MSSLGSRIAHLRNKEGLSQEEFAKVLKIGKSTLGMYETDKREPSHEMSNKIAIHFNVSLDWLLTGKEKSSAAALIEFLEMELTNEDILKRMNFTVDGMTLSEEEANEFVDFVRVKRLMKKQLSTGAKHEGS